MTDFNPQVSPDEKELRAWFYSLAVRENPYGKNALTKEERVSGQWVTLLYDSKKEAYALTDEVEAAKKVKLGLGKERVTFKKPSFVYYPKALLPQWAQCAEGEAGEHPLYGYLNLKKEELILSSCETSEAVSKDFSKIREFVNPEDKFWRYANHLFHPSFIQPF